MATTPQHLTYMAKAPVRLWSHCGASMHIRDQVSNESDFAQTVALTRMDVRSVRLDSVSEEGSTCELIREAALYGDE